MFDQIVDLRDVFALSAADHHSQGSCLKGYHKLQMKLTIVEPPCSQSQILILWDSVTSKIKKNLDDVFLCLCALCDYQALV